MQLGHEDFAGGDVLDAVEQLAGDAEARRHDAAGLAGVHAFGEDLDRQGAADQTPQRRRDPETFVVEAPRVEADDEARRADLVAECFEVGRQIGEPLSSLASISTTQRWWEPFPRCTASIAVSDANAA